MTMTASSVGKYQTKHFVLLRLKVKNVLLEPLQMLMYIHFVVYNPDGAKTLSISV